LGFYDKRTTEDDTESSVSKISSHYFVTNGTFYVVEFSATYRLA